ncbi:hypothetical protein LTR53_014005, partial [Teratosphaeriaceae sp. CCFEE 6253]
MVTRKPFPHLSTALSPKDKDPHPANPPYPTTPTAHPRSPGFTELDRTKTIHSVNSVYSPDLNSSPAFDLIDMNAARQRPARRDSDVSSHGTWDSEEEGERDGDADGTSEEDARARAALDVPRPLAVRKSQEGMRAQQQQLGEGNGKGKEKELPAILKPGPLGGVQARRSQEYEDEARGNPWASPTEGKPSLDLQPVSYNPYRQQGAVAPAPSQEQSAWQHAEQAPPVTAPPGPPVELSTAPKTPSDELKSMSLGEAPQQPHRPEPRPFETAEILSVPRQGRPSGEHSRQEAQELPSNNPWRTPSQERAQDQQQLSAPYPSSPGAAYSPPNGDQHFPPPPPGPPPTQYVPLPGPPPSHEQQLEQHYYPPPPGPPPKGTPSTSLIDHDDPPSRLSDRETSQRPQPPPLSSGPAHPAHPAPESNVPDTPTTSAKRQRSEHYQIKHIAWSDAARPGRTRHSPILTQNANGPCPLLALVNALVLTTPPDADTALVETLRSREQVSLGLLLDAVFEELMSGRRSGGDTGEALPDVGELYAFLLALHTGMNVNPRFLAPAVSEPPRASQTTAGGFEQTREMRLYGTFRVPLLHGWTAAPGSPAYEAFARHAGTFEEAQNVQFLEPELEAKLGAEGLSSEERGMLDDVRTIRAFLAAWPTQLTDYGLETLS